MSECGDVSPSPHGLQHLAAAALCWEMDLLADVPSFFDELQNLHDTVTMHIQLSPLPHQNVKVYDGLFRIFGQHLSVILDEYFACRE